MKILTTLALTSLFLLQFAFADTLKAPEVITPPVVDRIAINTFISYYADKYNVSEKELSTVIKCESGFNPNAVNMKDSHALSQGSHGISQFSKETIKGFGKAIGLENADPYNPQEAIEVMAYMFSLGESGKNHWSCYKKFF